VFNSYYYGFQGVRNLKEKSFHGIMFLLIQSFAVAIILCFALYLAFYDKNLFWPFHVTNDPALPYISFGFNMLGWFLNTIVHLLFVMKIWIVSKKVEQVVTGTEDLILECKAKSLTIFLIFVSAMSCVVIYFSIVYQNSLLYTVMAYLIDIPPLCCVYILATAFYRLSRFKEKVPIVSKQQVWLQMTSNSLYALVNPLPLIFS